MIPSLPRKRDHTTITQIHEVNFGQVLWLDPADVCIERFDWRAGDVAFLVLQGEFGEDGQVQTLLTERGSYSRCCHPMKPTTRNSLVRQSLPRRSLPYMILTDDNSSFGLHTAP